MATAPPQKYHYKPFAFIRLLQLYRDQDKALCGQLQNFDLDNGRCPKFTTVSYVWGEPRYSNSIQLDGIPFPVLDNVFGFLEALCDYECFGDDRWVWIDSICINQDDVHERALQVQLMGRIYRESTKTVIWLASGTPQIQTAIRHLHELAVFHQSKYGYLKPEDLENPGFWDALTRFFQHPWWARVWTLQEFILPSALRFQCGGVWIGFGAFNHAMEALYTCSRIGLGSSDIWGVGWGRRRVRHLFRQPETGGRLSLVALLAVTGSYQCQDPRDRIYSLLGLAREEDQGIVGQPDYNPQNTVEAVYTKLVANFIKVFRSLDIICFAPIFTSQSSSGQNPEAVWPSWLPDWRVQVRPQFVPLMVSQPSKRHIGCFRPRPWPEITRKTDLPSYSASGALEPHISFDISARTLCCQGIYLDNIDGMAARMVREGDTPERKSTQSTSPVNVGMQDYICPRREDPAGGVETNVVSVVVRTVTIDRNFRYLEDWAPVQQYCGELYQILRQDDEGVDAQETLRDSALDIHSRLARHWVEENGCFLIRGQNLLEICRSAMPYGDGPALRRPFRLPERLLDTIGRPNRRGAKVLATLFNGHLGLVPLEARRGDAVWILKGCSVPVVLRKQPLDGQWTLIGECYVHGFMNGEAFYEGSGFQVAGAVIG